jgi:hypothetical protein
MFRTLRYDTIMHMIHSSQMANNVIAAADITGGSLFVIGQAMWRATRRGWVQWWDGGQQAAMAPVKPKPRIITSPEMFTMPPKDSVTVAPDGMITVVLLGRKMRFRLESVTLPEPPYLVLAEAAIIDWMRRGKFRAYRIGAYTRFERAGKSLSLHLAKRGLAAPIPGQYEAVLHEPTMVARLRGRGMWKEAHVH